MQSLARAKENRQLDHDKLSHWSKIICFEGEFERESESYDNVLCIYHFTFHLLICLLHNMNCIFLSLSVLFSFHYHYFV